MPWHLYLALKHLFPAGRRFPFFTAVSIVGVMLGVGVLVIVLSVMGGFGAEIRRKVVDTSGHLRIESGRIVPGAADLVRQLEARPGVEAAAPYAHGMVMLQFDNRPTFPAIRGVDVEREGRIVPFDRYLLGGRLDDLDDAAVILSSGLANSLGARFGSIVDVYSPLMLERLKRDSVLLPRQLRVVGIYETGWHQVDANSAVVTLRLMQDLYGLGSGVHGVAVRLKPGVDIDAAVEGIGREVPAGLRVISWLESNRDFLFVLQLEKNMMFFLLLFIVLVSSFAITSSMLITVVRKTREIGLLGAMGGSPADVAKCFCWQGFLIGLAGTLLGIGFGLLALHFRNDIIEAFTALTGSEAALVRFYQFAHLPVNYAAGDFVRIAGFSLLFSTVAGFLPAWRASRLRPAEALRSE